ncbi:MAG: DUF6164 family protein [Gammaproteobacteria bacterium]|nr:DUF6164 family protein [Gammaproteobacteria bacterium]
MAKLLFKLKNVFDDEADEVRQLLTENNIDFYESPAGNWGISLHALWLNDDAQFATATSLIDQYQQNRTKRIKAEVQAQKDRGEQITFLQSILNKPLQYLIYTGFILFILYISIIPFIEIGH